MEIRDERAQDITAIHRLNKEAFGSDTEANLVDSLRTSDVPMISLVAVNNETVVGHILFTPMNDADGNAIPVAGLAPMAVLPAYQNQGIGSALVREGLECCQVAGYQAVVVLGHPAYYPRFGFLSASHFDIQSQYDVPDEAFMALELKAGALDRISGTVKYHSVFDEAV